MPSPFPGMDPYLEDPARWPDVHGELIADARASLNAKLGPKYVAAMAERVYISRENDPGRRVIVPDVYVAHSPVGANPWKPVGGSRSSAAVIEPIEVTTLIEQEIHEPRIDIIDGERNVVVTVIEILSPANKVPGAQGRGSFQRKREEVMNSSANLIEVDLLREGEAFPPYEPLPPHHYRVHVSRVQKRPRGLLWPIHLEQRLPAIAVPLRGEDPDVELDLQAVLEVAYDRGAFGRRIDYRASPAPPLPPAEAAWADRVLRESGLR